MFLLNYDLHDLYSVLTMLRAYPEKEYNALLIRAVIQVLSEPQRGDSIAENSIRKKLRRIDTLDKDCFRWAYVNNVYTYGLKVVKDDDCYSFLEKGFRKLLVCAETKDYQRLEALADALHNVPIFFAEGCKNFKKATKVEFVQYNRKYQTDLLKELSE